jgi:hypothetical protein
MTRTIKRKVTTTNITARILKILTAHPPLELRLAAILIPSILSLAVYCPGSNFGKPPTFGEAFHAS